MAKFNDDHKKDRGNFFNEGVHKVQIEDVEFGVTQPKDGGEGKEYAEFTIIDPSNEETKAQVRLWFTTDAAIGYSFSVIKGIFTHNAPEKDKEKMKAEIDKCNDTEELAKLCETLRGKECWYSTYKSADRTYTNQNGEVKPQYDTNIYGYEPKPRPVQQAQNETANEVMGGGEEITKENLDSEFPFK